MTLHDPAGARLARTPEPPYYAVIFSSRRTPGESADQRMGYDRMAQTMVRMALAEPGCLGAESARDVEGFGITVSYWRDEASIRAWKAKTAHLSAQRQGRARWYADYAVRVARVERAYDRWTSRFEEGAAPRLEPQGSPRK